MRSIRRIALVSLLGFAGCRTPGMTSEDLVPSPVSPARTTSVAQVTPDVPTAHRTTTATTSVPTNVETSPLGYRLVYPADWQLMRQTEFEERTARSPDGLSLISVAPYPAPLSEADRATQRPFYLFSFVAPGSKDEPPVTWPDGSVYRLFTGTDQTGRPIAGATRIVRLADGKIFVMLYSTTPERWLTERAQAEILLAQSGPTP